MGTQNILKTMHLSLLNADDCLAYNWNFRRVISPFTRMYLIKRGEGFIIHNHKKYELRPDSLYLIPSLTLCNYSSDTFLEHYYIHFIPQISGAANIFDFIDFEYEVPAADEDPGLMKRILELNPRKKLLNIDPCKYSRSNLLPNAETLDSSGQIAVYLETQGILLQLFSRFIKTGNEKTGVRDFKPNIQISNAVDHIHQNLAKPIMIGELAEICHLSNDYFSRLFLKVMGTRPVDYINRKRIESAQLLLITSNDLIEKIALETGIENFSYFNRMFKKYSCTTPGEYRRLHKLV